MPVKHQLYPLPYPDSIFLQESRSETVRLKTSASGEESTGSARK